ncbi:MAG: DUF4259 domain-containing protein [Clostridia bacterium]
MGAWSHEIFGNDDAMDWVGELLEAEDLSVVEQVLQETADEDDYIEVDLASQALAAAEVVAFLGGKPGAELQPDSDVEEELLAWLKKRNDNVDHLKPLALQVVRKVKASSEETEDYQLWLDTVTDLEGRLV